MIINYVLTADNRSEVHFNAELSTPRAAWFFGGFLFGPIALIAAAGLGDQKLRLHHLPPLHLRGGSALPRPLGLQPQETPTAARSTPEERCTL